MRFFILLFITVPIIEMWLLIEVGSQIGALSTIFLVFLTAAIGLALLRQQGLATLLRVNEKMTQGQLPASEILEGVALAVGGALLLTPGFVTDAIGFACLIPFSRRLIVALLLKNGIKSMTGGQAGVYFSGNLQGHSGRDPNSDRVDSASDKNSETIEGDFRREK